MRKEAGLSATVRVTLGSLEVMRVGAWGPGQLQTSAVSPRRLGRAGLEDSCLGTGGDVWILGRRFGQLTFQCPFIPQLGHDLKQAMTLGMGRPSGLLYHI